MGKVIAGMTLSLDGFVNDRDGSVGPLYSDFSELHDVASFQEIIDNTGAVVMGRHAYEMGEPDTWGEYEFQTPIFVLTHQPPLIQPPGNDKLSFTYVADGIESAVTRARKAAAGKDVQIVGGADTIQQALNAGLVDELFIDIVPVLLGKGLRLFENLQTDHIKLEKVRIEESTPVRVGMVLRVKYEQP